MKTLITALAFSAAAIAPLTALATPRKHAHAGNQIHVSENKTVTRPHIYRQGADLGMDPDRNIRFQIRRDAHMSSSNQ